MGKQHKTNRYSSESKSTENKGKEGGLGFVVSVDLTKEEKIKRRQRERKGLVRIGRKQGKGWRSRNEREFEG